MGKPRILVVDDDQGTRHRRLRVLLNGCSALRGTSGTARLPILLISISAVPEQEEAWR
jgi:hypothetical protein